MAENFQIKRQASPDNFVSSNPQTAFHKIRVERHRFIKDPVAWIRYVLDQIQISWLNRQTKFLMEREKFNFLQGSSKFVHWARFYRNQSCCWREILRLPRKGTFQKAFVRLSISSLGKKDCCNRELSDKTKGRNSDRSLNLNISIWAIMARCIHVKKEDSRRTNNITDYVG